MNVIRALQDVRLRGTDQQVGDELLARGAAMTYIGTRNPDTGIVQPPVTVRGAMAITNYALQNRSGGAASVGLGFRLRNDQWKAGQWDDSEGAASFVNDTVDAQDTGASDFAMEVVASNNDGFVIACVHKFDWVSINVGTAGVDGDGSLDRVVQYSNAAGTGWTVAPTNIYTDEFTVTAGTDVYSTGENLFVWMPPQDWGKVTIADATMGGGTLGYYALQIRSTDAPSGGGQVAALASTIEIGTLPVLVENVADNAVVSEETCFLWEPFGDAIVAYFSTANGGNSVKAEWRHAG